MRLVAAFAIVSLLTVFSANARELKVLNLNMWAVEIWLPEFIAKSPSVDLDDRLKRLPLEIAKLSPDVVVFEEVWSAGRATQIIDSLKAQGFIYSLAKSSYKGLLSTAGNGLLIVSKLKLDTDSQSMSFTSTTRWNESKLICRKGAIKTRVEVEPHAWVDLYATHLGASGLVFGEHGAKSFLPEEYAAQIEQTKELVAFIKQTRTSPDVILAADLNSHPFAFEDGQYSTTKPNEVYRLLTCASASADCGHLVDSAKDAKFFTYDTLHNTYANHADFANEPEGRIDYVFTDGPNVQATNASLAFTEKPLSDHYGLMNTITYDAHPEIQQAQIRQPAAQ